MLLGLGNGYRATRQWQLAKQSFDQALRAQADLPQAHFNLGLMYMSAGGAFPGLDIVTALQRARTRKLKPQAVDKLRRDFGLGKEA